MQEQFENQDEIQIDLLDLARTIVRKWWVIVLCLVIGAGTMGIYTKTMLTPMYSASSSIYVLGTTTNISGYNLSLSNQLTSDFTILAKSRPVVERVIEDLKLDTTYEGLVGSITVENPGETTIMKTTVTNSDPELARDISNAMSDAIRKRIAEVMDIEQPNVVEEAVTPKSPISPNVQKNVSFGALVGAALAVGILVLLYIMDDTIKNADDVKKHLGIDTLAAFPAGGKKRSAI